MKKRIFGAVVLLSLVSQGALAQSAGQWRDSQQIFAKTCAYCHLVGVGPVLEGRQLPSEYVAAVVRHGKLAMPAFRPTELDDAELAALARMISNSPALSVPSAGGH